MSGDTTIRSRAGVGARPTTLFSLGVGSSGPAGVAPGATGWPTRSAISRRRSATRRDASGSNSAIVTGPSASARRTALGNARSPRRLGRGAAGVVAAQRVTDLGAADVDTADRPQRVGELGVRQTTQVHVDVRGGDVGRCQHGPNRLEQRSPRRVVDGVQDRVDDHQIGGRDAAVGRVGGLVHHEGPRIRRTTSASTIDGIGGIDSDIGDGEGHCRLDPSPIGAGRAEEPVDRLDHVAADAMERDPMVDQGVHRAHSGVDRKADDRAGRIGHRMTEPVDAERVDPDSTDPADADPDPADPVTRSAAGMTGTEGGTKDSPRPVRDVTLQPALRRDLFRSGRVELTTPEWRGWLESLARRGSSGWRSSPRCARFLAPHSSVMTIEEREQLGDRFAGLAPAAKDRRGPAGDLQHGVERVGRS